MNWPTLSCLTVFLGLLAASVVLQWVRATSRKRLVASVDFLELAPAEQERWRSIDRSPDFLFKDFRKLQLLKRNPDRFGVGFPARLASYRRISRVEMTVTLAMLAFGITAFLFCG
jgi:hypothetical protein